MTHLCGRQRPSPVPSKTTSGQFQNQCNYHWSLNPFIYDTDLETCWSILISTPLLFHYHCFPSSFRNWRIMPRAGWGFCLCSCLIFLLIDIMTTYKWRCHQGSCTPTSQVDSSTSLPTVSGSWLVLCTMWFMLLMGGESWHWGCLLSVVCSCDFRSLPEPLMTFKLHEQFIKAASKLCVCMRVCVCVCVCVCVLVLGGGEEEGHKGE